MRPIDADALKMEFPKDEDWDYPVNTNGYVCELIDKQPTIEPERKRGEWIEHNPHKWGLGIKYECSECGYEVDCEEPNYCPNCGCEMER